VDKGDGGLIWRVVAKILKMELKTADKGWTFSLVLGGALTTPHHEDCHVTRCYKQPQTWNGYFETTKSMENGSEICNLNIRILYRSGSLKSAIKLAKCK